MTAAPEHDIFRRRVPRRARPGLRVPFDYRHFEDDAVPFVWETLAVRRVLQPGSR